MGEFWGEVVGDSGEGGVIVVYTQGKGREGEEGIDPFLLFFRPLTWANNNGGGYFMFWALG